MLVSSERGSENCRRRRSHGTAPILGSARQPMPNSLTAALSRSAARHQLSLCSTQTIRINKKKRKKKRNRRQGLESSAIFSNLRQRRTTLRHSTFQREISFKTCAPTGQRHPQRPNTHQHVNLKDGFRPNRPQPPAPLSQHLRLGARRSRAAQQHDPVSGRPDERVPAHPCRAHRPLRGGLPSPQAILCTQGGERQCTISLSPSPFFSSVTPLSTYPARPSFSHQLPSLSNAPDNAPLTHSAPFLFPFFSLNPLLFINHPDRQTDIPTPPHPSKPQY